MRGGGGGLLVASEGGKEPERVAVGAPVVAQHLQGARGERDVAITGALAAVDVDEAARTVDVADLEVEGLGEAESERVDGPEVGAVVRRAGGVDHAVDLLATQHIGQGMRARDGEAIEEGPLTRGDAAIEEADAVEGEAERGGCPALLVLHMEEVVAQVGFGELVGWTVEVLGQLAHGTEVGLLGALAEAGELQLGAHALALRGGADRGAHEQLLSQGVNDGPTERKMRRGTRKVAVDEGGGRTAVGGGTHQRREAGTAALAAYLNNGMNRTEGAPCFRPRGRSRARALRQLS
jgi:hypothetical protein